MDGQVACASRVRRWFLITGRLVALVLIATDVGHAQTASPSPERSPEPTIAVTPAPRSRCDEYVAVLSGKTKNDALLADPKVREIAAQSFDLLACRAVATDSDAPCALVPDHQVECRLLRSVLHELRTNPEGRSFMFPEAKYQLCRTDPELAPACDRLRAAALSGDPNECTGAGDQEAGCRAMVSLDKSQCAKAKDPEFCIKSIDASLVFSKGLKGLAESGPPRERAFAKAALGEADACAPFEQAATASCAALTSGATTSPAAATTPAAARSGKAARSR